MLNTHALDWSGKFGHLKKQISGMDIGAFLSVKTALVGKNLVPIGSKFFPLSVASRRMSSPNREAFDILL